MSKILLVHLFALGSVSVSIHATSAPSNNVTLPTTNTSSIQSVIRDKEYFEHACYEKFIPDQDDRNDCCEFVKKRFKQRWPGGGHHLTDYLRKLKIWNCSQLSDECSNPMYAFNQFTKLVYDKFCRRNILLAKCTEVLLGVVESQGFTVAEGTYSVNDVLHISEQIWNNLSESLEASKLDLDELNRPCIQIALFDRTNGYPGRFHEVVEPFAPFCDIVWAGYDIDTAMTRHVSPWTSMSIRCRSSIIICMTLLVALGIAIIIANLTVISVFMSNPQLRNSQAVFKLSIALGDLLIGLVVFPNIIIFQYLMFISRRKMGDKLSSNFTPEGYNKSGLHENATIDMRKAGGGFNSRFVPGHLEFVGFFTTVSFMVSIYTLLAASFDRFFAIHRPLKYNKQTAKKFAKYACIGIWAFSVIIALVPIILESMRYALVASIVVSSAGKFPLILLSVGFVIPLLLLWGSTIGTWRAAKRHAQVRRKLRGNDARKVAQDAALERRLSRTLGLMVGVFTLCVSPALLSVIIVHFFDNVMFSIPERVDPHAAMISNSFEYCAYMILLTNSLWNCLIYSTRAKEFRTATKKIYLYIAAATFVRCVSHSARYIVSSARRLSESSLSSRRKSSSSSTITISGRKRSSAGTITTKMSIPTDDSSSVFYAESSTASNLSASSRNTGHRTPMVYYSKVVGSKGKKFPINDNDGDEVSDSSTTFGSFAIDAGADRLFLSVMENIEEVNDE